MFGTESWLDASISDSEVFPKGFVSYRKDRSRLGGGVFLLVHSSLRSSPLELGHDAIESIWCTVTLPGSSSYVLGSYYRPPNSDLSIIRSLYDIVSEASNQIILLAGDFNLPDLEWRDGTCVCTIGSRNNLEMKNIVDTFGLQQYVSEPTRNNHILDLLFCSSPYLINTVNIIPGISDHHAVVANIQTEIKRVNSCESRKVFFFEKGNYSGFSEELLDRLPVFECLSEEYDVHNLWDVFKKMLLQLTDKYVPCIDSRKLKKRRKPWVTSSTLRIIKKRRRAFDRYKKTKSSNHLEKLAELTREYKRSIKGAKEQYLNTLNDRLKTNPKLFWKYLKGCGSDAVGISEITYNQQTVSDDTEKATCFNNYFRSVFLPKHNYVNPSTVSTVELMQPVELGMSGIEKALKNIDETKATGPDGISPRVLKRCAYPISVYLYLIFSKSLDTGLLPDDWKVAHIVPIHKGETKKDVVNYRPISLTSVSCKVIEHILYSEVIGHMIRNNLLINEQHGFRKGFSCTTQLVEFYHDLASDVDEGGQIDCIFLDFRKAFDTVSHSLLLNKLRMLNLDSAVLRWIENYLFQRRQCVVLNGKKSDYVDVTSGVPQGSVLGPLLFLIYINDISVGISSCIRLFADDCVVYRKIKSSDDVAQLQADLDRIQSWCSTWKMNLNHKKCVNLCFTKKRKQIESQYFINNNPITKELTYKYLGVILSSDCSWNAHIEEVVLKAGRAMNFIQRNLKCSQPNLKTTAYLTCVRPILEYACAVWDPAQKTLIDKLEKIQNRAARFVLGRYGRKESCTEMKKMLNWEPLSVRREKLRLKFLYSIVKNKTGINSETYLKEPYYVSSRNDHSLKIREYRARTCMFANSFFVRTIAQWNRLSEEQVCCFNEDVFFSSL